jgi:RNA dependent RNA polymerase
MDMPGSRGRRKEVDVRPGQHRVIRSRRYHVREVFSGHNGTIVFCTHVLQTCPYQATLACTVIITPSRILLEGPYTTQSNRAIRHYQCHDPSLAERFVLVEFRDEDRLAYRWDGNVDGTWFLSNVLVVFCPAYLNSG